MKFMTAEKYIEREFNIRLPEGDIILGSWFAENDLPMIVECASCGMSMPLLSALIDEEGYCCCPSCAGV